MLNVLYLYVSTLQSMCAVPNMAVVCSSLIDFVLPACCSGIFWMVLRWFQLPLLLLASLVFLHSACAVFLLLGLYIMVIIVVIPLGDI